MKGRVVRVNVEVNNFKRPRAKLHHARLLVKGKVRDVNWTRAPKRGWRVPCTPALVINNDTGLVFFKSTAELIVRTAR